MDFIEGLPKSQDYDVILVVVDHFTKYGHFIPLTLPFIASRVVELFMKNAFKLHGLPRSIVLDKGLVFLSYFWKSLFFLQGSTLKFSSVYHSEIDGQTEVLNRCLEGYLRCYAVDQPLRWAHWLSFVEWSYNTSYHIVIKLTPFEALYGYKPPQLLSYIPSISANEATDQTLCTRDQVLIDLKRNL